jgi:hypothetical protein
MRSFIDESHFPARWRVVSAFLVCLGTFQAAHAKQDPRALEFFETKIRPLLVENCYTCHSADTNAHGGLRVDDRVGLLGGGNRGAAVVPGEPEKSLLLRAVRYTDKKLKMPPEGPLSDEQIADFTKWIQDGAAWPAVETPDDLDAPHPEYDELKATHWAWQPLRKTTPPAVADPAWSADPVDRFLLATLEQQKLKPVRDAEKFALLRRVTFDLTGLPPSPEELDAFLADNSAAAFAKVVDRLLASPAYGERWGRHWLDVARYGESTGSSRNMPYPHAWRYRDYVIDAFNADMSYDQFLREQIAGDLLPVENEEQRQRQLVATGFLALGVKDVNQRFKVRFTMDNVDEQIDTVTRSVLGLTASCARCHDHKFDPIPTKDYYALAGIFTSTEICAGVRSKMGGGGLDYYTPQMLLRLSEGDAPPPDPAAVASAQAKYDEAKEAFQAIRGTPEGLKKQPNGRPKQRQFRVKMDRALAALMELTDPTLRGEAAIGVRDAATIADTEVRLRGEAEQLGPVVPRGYLSVVALQDAPAIPNDQSGRLQLAEWLTRPDNPLTARVIVNRVWQHLFGRGLVASVDNFGVTGDAPSHPELLDFLATRFVADGWSIKTLVRELVLTRAYQLSADEEPANLELDPANRFVWRHAPRRLDAEELRDATLAAAHALDAERPEGSLARDLKVVELLDSSPIARRLEAAARKDVHRSVYLPLVRGLTPTSLAVFDFAEQGMVTGDRDATTVATQALYLLNDSFVRRNAVALAATLLNDSGDSSDVDRIALAYRRVLGRAPTTDETQRAQAYIADFEIAAAAIAPGDAQLAAAPSVSDEPADNLLAGGGDPVDPPQNPDELPAVEAPVIEETIGPLDSKTAAWASFCQALFGSAEFRYTK